MVLDFGVPYLVEDLTIAAYDMVTEKFTTPQAFLFVGGIEIGPKFDTDTLMNKGAVERMLAVLTSLEIKATSAGFDYRVMQILTGIASALSPSSGQRDFNVPGGNNAKYFGAIAKLPIDDGGVLQVGWAWLKCLDGLYELKADEKSQFSKKEMQWTAGRLRKANNSLVDMHKEKYYSVNTALPATAGEFNSWFGLA